MDGRKHYKLIYTLSSLEWSLVFSFFQLKKKWYLWFYLISPYNNLCVLDPSKEGCKLKGINSLAEFLQENQLSIEGQSTEVDNSLLKISQAQSDNKEALLSLRCRVSHSIIEKIRRECRRISILGSLVGPTFWSYRRTNFYNTNGSY